MHTPTIQDESLKVENDFSSMPHAIHSMAFESAQEQEQTFTIPLRYHENQLMLLPINPHSYYVYWEVLPQTLKDLNINLHQQTLCFRIYNMQGDILFTFESAFDLAEYFFNITVQQDKIYAVMGILKNNTFIEILRSNIVQTANTTIKLPDVSNEQWLEKYENCLKLIKLEFEYTHTSSSSNSIKEFEEFAYINRLIKQSGNSTTLIGQPS
jgi:hypothetical protein